MEQHKVLLHGSRWWSIHQRSKTLMSDEYEWPLFTCHLNSCQSNSLKPKSVSFKPIFPSIKQAWQQESAALIESHWKELLSFISWLSRIKFQADLPTVVTREPARLEANFLLQVPTTLQYYTQLFLWKQIPNLSYSSSKSFFEALSHMDKHSRPLSETHWKWK